MCAWNAVTEAYGTLLINPPASGTGTGNGTKPPTSNLQLPTKQLSGVDKVDRTTFHIWLRILKRVPRSVLWFLDHARKRGRVEKRGMDSDTRDDSAATTALANLRREASVAGVDPNRIFFRHKSPWIDHISDKQRNIDLVLDTSLVRSLHSSALDAGWGAIPVLTLAPGSGGDTPTPLRVPRTVSRALGCGDLTTAFSWKDFEDLAVRFVLSSVCFCTFPFCSLSPLL